MIASEEKCARPMQPARQRRKRRWFSGKGTPRLYYGAASSSIGRGPEVEKYNHSDEIVEGAIFRTVVPLMRGPEAGHESN